MAEDIENKDEAHHLNDELSITFECVLHDKWIGVITTITEDKVETIFKPTQEMVIDSRGLLHSPFFLNACEFAALAILNHEKLFVQSVELEYLAPIEIGTEYEIKATIKYRGEKKKIILVQAFSKQIKVFEGTFSILELDQHILDIRLNEHVEVDIEDIEDKGEE